MCGMEPCALRPGIRMRMESQAANCGPALDITWPARPGMTCWPKQTSGKGILSTKPSSTIASAPAPISSPGWNKAMKVPDHLSRVLSKWWHMPTSAAV